jgi:hypothetical protein
VRYAIATCPILILRPRYAEVLENTQYALIVTVQKLYIMVRNNKSWEFGEPEINVIGQPVIHDIASKLGCFRPLPELPVAVAQSAEVFRELQAELQIARTEIRAEDARSRTHGPSPSSPPLAHTERASNAESNQSELSKEYNQNL